MLAHSDERTFRIPYTPKNTKKKGLNWRKELDERRHTMMPRFNQEKVCSWSTGRYNVVWVWESASASVSQNRRGKPGSPFLEEGSSRPNKDKIGSPEIPGHGIGIGLIGQEDQL